MITDKYLLHMKKNYCISSLILASAFLAGCANDITEADEVAPETTYEYVNQFNTRAFPATDGAAALSGTPAKKMYNILTYADSAFATTYATYKITDEQVAEIKAFADNLIVGATTEYQKYRKIYTWVCQNVKYADGYVSNEPYDVFKQKTAVCQGYANLLNVMLRTQGIMVVTSNGYLIPVGGHAWNYVKCGSLWYLSDPTNSIQYTASGYTSYEGQFAPLSADGNFFEDEVAGYNYVYETINLNVVKKAEDVFTVPYSVKLNKNKKYQISCFSPTQDMPENVKEVYIGKNITSLGQDNVIGLRDHGKNIEAAHVDPANKTLSSFCGVVYHNDMKEPLYIPTAMTRMTLRPTQTVGKNFIYNHPNLEELHFMEGTQNIEAWAVENCPNLKYVYIPLQTKYDENAFMKVHPEFQVIRQDQTGIRDVLAD